MKTIPLKKMKNKMIRNSFLMVLTVLMTGCGIYKPYTRPEVSTEGIYRETVNAADTASLADLDWRSLFSDATLQELIDTVLVRNTDLRSAQLQVEAAEATCALRGCRCCRRSRLHRRAA